MKLFRMILSAAGIMLLLFGIDGMAQKVKGESSMTNQEAKAYLMELFGLQEEELAGLDAIRFIEDYQIGKVEYTGDLIRMVLTDEGASYLDDGTTELYSILDKEGKAPIPHNVSLARVGYIYNNGTFNQRGVFDLVNEKYYVNDAEAKELNVERKEYISNLVTSYNVDQWEPEYIGKEENSTGWLSWKIVFEDDEGSAYIYSGKTRDGKPLPDTFKEVMDELLGK